MALTPLWGSGYTFITYYPAIMFHRRGQWLATWCCRHPWSPSVLTIVLFFDMQASPGEQQTALALFITANVIIVALRSGHACSSSGRRRRHPW